VKRSLGETLTHERESRDLSLRQISEITRIPRSTLQHLEDEHFEKLPGRAYVVGYLRAYARALNLDPAPLLQHFHQQTGEVPTMAPPPPPPQPLWRRHLPWLVGATVALIISLVMLAARP